MVYAISITLAIICLFTWPLNELAAQEQLSVNQPAAGLLSGYRLSQAITHESLYLKAGLGNSIDKSLVVLMKKVAYNTVVNCKMFSAVYNKPKIDENKAISEAWKQALGVDVWLPYYKAKEVEGWVKKKFTVKIFSMKGEPQLERNRVSYTFCAKF